MGHLLDADTHGPLVDTRDASEWTPLPPAARAWLLRTGRYPSPSPEFASLIFTTDVADTISQARTRMSRHVPPATSISSAAVPLHSLYFSPPQSEVSDRSLTPTPSFDHDNLQAWMESRDQTPNVPLPFERPLPSQSFPFLSSGWTFGGNSPSGYVPPLIDLGGPSQLHSMDNIDTPSQASASHAARSHECCDPPPRLSTPKRSAPLTRTQRRRLQRKLACARQRPREDEQHRQQERSRKRSRTRSRDFESRLNDLYRPSKYTSRQRTALIGPLPDTVRVRYLALYLLPKVGVIKDIRIDSHDPWLTGLVHNRVIDEAWRISVIVLSRDGDEAGDESSRRQTSGRGEERSKRRKIV